MKTRLKRGTIGAMLALLVFGAGAFADSHVDDASAPVTLSTITGQRMLQLTGADLGTGSATEQLGGPVLFAFGHSGVQAPFGTVVTDLAYPNTGYDVYAELSNLYPLADDGSVDCGTTGATGIESKNLFIDDRATVGIANVNTVLTEVDATLETALELAGTIEQDDLEIISSLPLGLSSGDLTLSDPIDLLVSDIGVVDSVRNTFDATVDGVLDGLNFMNRSVGTDDGTFHVPTAHPSNGCETTGGGTPTKVYLQEGDADPDPLDSLPQAIFDAVRDGDDLSVDEAITGGLLPDNTLDSDEGSLWAATRSAVEESLLSEFGDLLNSLIGLDDLIDLDGTTQNVVGDLVADTLDDLDLTVVAQNGVYPSIQTLNVDRNALSGQTTGTYHGVMTVTLVNDPEL